MPSLKAFARNQSFLGLLEFSISKTKFLSIVKSSKPQKTDKYGHDLNDNEIKQKILVAVDGSVSSMRALNYVNYVMKESSNIKVYLTHIIEWSDDDESMDEEMTL